MPISSLSSNNATVYLDDLLNKTNELVAAHNAANTDFYDLRSNVSSLSTNFTHLHSNVDSLSTNFTHLHSNVDSLSTNFTQLYSNVSALKTNFDQLWSNTNSLSTNFTQLYSNVSALKTNFDQLHANVVFATQSDAEAGSNSSAIMTPLNVSQALISRPIQFKNLLARNGGFEVCQRVSPVSLASSATAYTIDGWYLATQANQNSTIYQINGITSGSYSAVQIYRNGGQTGTGTMRFAFPLSSVEAVPMRNKKVVLSFSAKAGANWSPTSGTLTYNLYCGTNSPAKRNGSAYTGETNPITGSVNLSPGAGSATRVVSSVSSTVGSSILCAEVQFSWSPTGTAGADDWIQLDDVQLEIVPDNVTSFTPEFERIPYHLSVTMCEAFYRYWYVLWQGVVADTGYQTTVQVSWPLMRTTPSINILGGSDSSRWTYASSSVAGVSNRGCTILRTSSLSGGNEAWDNNGNATAEI